MRQETYANNLANVNTPRFSRSDVRFEEILRAQMQTSRLALSTTNSGHIPNPTAFDLPRPEMIKDTTTSMRNDGNNVDVDREMAGLAENGLRFSALSRQMAKRFAVLRSAITEGRR